MEEKIFKNKYIKTYLKHIWINWKFKGEMYEGKKYLVEKIFTYIILFNSRKFSSH